jgi:hypothetical protein
MTELAVKVVCHAIYPSDVNDMPNLALRSQLRVGAIKKMQMLLNDPQNESLVISLHKKMKKTKLWWKVAKEEDCPEYISFLRNWIERIFQHPSIMTKEGRTLISKHLQKLGAFGCNLNHYISKVLKIIETINHEENVDTLIEIWEAMDKAHLWDSIKKPEDYPYYFKFICEMAERTAQKKDFSNSYLQHLSEWLRVMDQCKYVYDKSKIETPLIKLGQHLYNQGDRVSLARYRDCIVNVELSLSKVRVRIEILWVSLSFKSDRNAFRSNFVVESFSKPIFQQKEIIEDRDINHAIDDFFKFFFAQYFDNIFLIESMESTIQQVAPILDLRVLKEVLKRDQFAKKPQFFPYLQSFNRFVYLVGKDCYQGYVDRIRELVKDLKTYDDLFLRLDKDSISDEISSYLGQLLNCSQAPVKRLRAHFIAAQYLPVNPIMASKISTILLNHLQGTLQWIATSEDEPADNPFNCFAIALRLLHHWECDYFKLFSYIDAIHQLSSEKSGRMLDVYYFLFDGLNHVEWDPESFKANKKTILQARQALMSYQVPHDLRTHKDEVVSQVNVIITGLCYRFSTLKDCKEPLEWLSQSIALRENSKMISTLFDLLVKLKDRALKEEQSLIPTINQVADGLKERCNDQEMILRILLLQLDLVKNPKLIHSAFTHIKRLVFHSNDKIFGLVLQILWTLTNNMQFHNDLKERWESLIEHFINQLSQNESNPKELPQLITLFLRRTYGSPEITQFLMEKFRDIMKEYKHSDQEQVKAKFFICMEENFRLNVMRKKLDLAENLDRVAHLGFKEIVDFAMKEVSKECKIFSEPFDRSVLNELKKKFLKTTGPTTITTIKKSKDGLFHYPH